MTPQEDIQLNEKAVTALNNRLRDCNIHIPEELAFNTNELLEMYDSSARILRHNPNDVMIRQYADNVLDTCIVIVRCADTSNPNPKVILIGGEEQSLSLPMLIDSVRGNYKLLKEKMC